MPILYESSAFCFDLLVVYLLSFIPSVVYSIVFSLVIVLVLRSLTACLVQRIVIDVDPGHPFGGATQMLCRLCGCQIKDESEVLR